jgi:hypothetical protein
MAKRKRVQEVVLGPAAKRLIRRDLTLVAAVAAVVAVEEATPLTLPIPATPHIPVTPRIPA